MQKYIFGPLDAVKSALPKYDYDHARKTLDGEEVVVLVEVDDGMIALLESDGLQVMDHAEALDEVNKPESEGIWYREILNSQF